MSKQYKIEHPITKKTIIVGRDAYNALQEAEKQNKSRQVQMGEDIKSIGQKLTQKYYTGTAKDVEIAVKFDEEGRLNQFDDPQVSINLDVDPETKAIAEQVLMQFIICMNQALEAKSSEMKDELKAVLGEAPKNPEAKAG